MSQQINLYQPHFRKQRRKFSARRLPAALGAVLAGSAILSGYAAMKTRELESLDRQAAAAVEGQRRQLAELKQRFPAHGTSKVLEAEVARLDAELQKRRRLVGSLSTGELGNTAGFSEFLAVLGRRDLPGVWLTGVTIADAGNLVQVQGRALGADLVPAYLESLGAEPVMQGRRVTELKLAAHREPMDKAPGKARAAGPQRYVEFAFSAPLSDAGAAPPAKGGAR